MKETAFMTPDRKMYQVYDLRTDAFYIGCIIYELCSFEPPFVQSTQELEEKQESGKVFTKLHLGKYTWQTYKDVAAQAESLGKGLRELGMAPKDKVCLQ